MSNLALRLRMEESGQGLVEYGFILGLVALAAIAGLQIFGASIDAKLRDMAGRV